MCSSPVAHQASGFPLNFSNMKQLEVFLLPSQPPPLPPADEMLGHCLVAQSIKFTSTHLYTWKALFSILTHHPHAYTVHVHCILWFKFIFGLFVYFVFQTSFFPMCHIHCINLEQTI